MSFFDDASLVMIPSGYKDQKVYSVKPTDGTGDLTFSRASGATRVGPDGLIEKVRTNLYPNGSALLSTGWSALGATLTAGQTDPNGGTTALRVQFAATSAYVFQGFNGSAAIYARSVFIKGATAQSIRLIEANTGFSTTINLTTSYQRFALVAAGIPPNFSIGFDNDNDNLAKDFTIAFVQIEEGDIATDYIPTTTAAVSVGPVSGLPRLDYLGSTCPRLLLEPQRSSLVTFSENFDNSAWIKTAATITPNNSTSPDGYTNADLILETTATSNHATVSDLISFVSGTTYTMSVFAKNISGGRGLLQVGGYQLAASLQDTFANFNLATGVVTQQTQSTAKIENYGNGWYRCSVTFACTNTISERLNVTLINSGTAGFSPSYAGDSSKGLLIWGAQMEAGAYATSYIPTLGASVTRVADAASKTSATALIGQTEGTIYWEVQKDAIPGNCRFQLSDGTSNNWLFVSVEEASLAIRIYAGVLSGTTVDVTSVATLNNNAHKIAFAYATNDFKVYVDGVEFLTHTSGNIPACSRLEIGNNSPTGAVLATSNTSQALLFKTRLTNAQLAELTTL